MALDIKIEKRKLNFQEDKKEVFVAVPDRNGVIDTDKMARAIAKDTGARPAQVQMIISSLVDSMMEWLEEGHGVRFGKLGSFLPSVKSKSAISVRSTTLIVCAMRCAPSRLSSSYPGVSMSVQAPMPGSSMALFTGSVVVPLMSLTTAIF